MPKTNYLATAIAKHIFGSDAFTQPADIYLALVSVDGTAAAAGTEATYTGYARKEMLFSVWTQSNGQLTNTATVTMAGCTGGSAETIVGFEIWDASTEGNRLYYATLTAPVTVSVTQTPLYFAASQLEIHET